MQAEWRELESAVKAAADVPLKTRFETEPGRLGRLAFDVAGLHIDLSKTHLDIPVVDAFETLAQAVDFRGERARLLHGQVVNATEGRAASHTAERGMGAPEHVRAADEARAAMRDVYDRIEGGAFGDVRHIIHIGIGGSFLGPALVIDALRKADMRYDVHIVSNIDGQALERALKQVDRTRTLLVTVSKSFSTLETMLNTESALAALGTDSKQRLIAVTAAPDRAAAFGVPRENILPFADTVGGRYSLWTGVGLAAVLALGWDSYDALLSGAAAMDRHFADAPLRENAPVMAAMMDLAYASVLGAETRAIFAYDERLALLPSFLQQLETESNGKLVDRDGKRLERGSAPVVWGGVGTDAQHAVFQLLHQGTHLIPAEFLAVREPGHRLGGAHHRHLLSNCIAQGAALMRGRSFEEAKAAGADDATAHAKTFPGDRPSATILLRRLDARTLGALLAFYEHRTFSFGALLEINSFDQMGVELGKDVARAIAEGDLGDLDPSSRDLLDRAGIL
ncbi:glucose-6-phosphate isomerase [Pacificimonas sp. WHA3]|uniref:Glucose-6-phosphate isomerase n=1 Tax=Pacificimonas pallii TaxID=2827236 RepID=A0ABS6SE00_9SPHN|nr:glucose-6-phosphate isomerase [Pacificimonas pallii]MBV7256634.1 glucose-6-phosphate isomerase [Pacificimonas pallii]